MRSKILALVLMVLAGAAHGQAIINGQSLGTLGTILQPSTALSQEQQAFLSGQEFVFSVGNNGTPANLGILTAAGSYLNVRICNTSATRTWYIAEGGRFFDSTSTTVTPYFGVGNPDALSTAQAAALSAGNTNAGTNLNGTAKQTDITFTFGVGSIMTVGGTAATPSGVGGIYPGIKSDINHARGVLPGTCFGQALVGQSTGLAGAATIQLGFRAYLYFLQ